MAKRWILDKFDGSGLLIEHTADSGQLWHTPTFPILSNGFTIGEGRATWEQSYAGTQPENNNRWCVVNNPTSTLNETKWVWTMERFPDFEPTNSWYFYQPAYALLVFGCGLDYAADIDCIGIGYNPLTKKMSVSDPLEGRSSAFDYLINPYDGGSGSNWDNYYPLPDLDDPSHPDEYVFELVYNNTTEVFTFSCNNVEIYQRTKLPARFTRDQTYTGIGVQMGRGALPQTGYVYDATEVFQWREFSHNYEPIVQVGHRPMKQLVRQDGVGVPGFQLSPYGVSNRAAGYYPLFQLNSE